jgi:hypothetical protein
MKGLGPTRTAGVRHREAVAARKVLQERSRRARGCRIACRPLRGCHPLRHRRTMILKVRVAVPEAFVAVMVTR